MGGSVERYSTLAAGGLKQLTKFTVNLVNCFRTTHDRLTEWSSVNKFVLIRQALILLE